MRSQIEEITRNLDRRLSIHDFRIVEGPTHTNLIFDIAVPFECKLTKRGDHKSPQRTHPQYG